MLLDTKSFVIVDFNDDFVEPYPLYLSIYLMIQWSNDVNNSAPQNNNM